MSVRYRPVQWSRLKLVYDALLLAFVIGYISVFQSVARALLRGAEALSAPILAMRAWGSCAFLLLSVILCIGPLARLDPRFLPLLYNRRHAGVLMCLVALGHAYQVLGFYFAWGKQSELTALLSYDTSFTAASVPFIGSARATREMSAAASSAPNRGMKVRMLFPPSPGTRVHAERCTPQGAGAAARPV